MKFKVWGNLTPRSTIELRGDDTDVVRYGPGLGMHIWAEDGRSCDARIVSIDEEAQLIHWEIFRISQWEEGTYLSEDERGMRGGETVTSTQILMSGTSRFDERV